MGSLQATYDCWIWPVSAPEMSGGEVVFTSMHVTEGVR